MNDFTKEELHTIDYLIDCYCQYSQPPEGVYAVLKNKIKPMIDNYCESSKCQHKNIITGAYPRSNPPKKCESCGVLYHD